MNFYGNEHQSIFKYLSFASRRINRKISFGDKIVTNGDVLIYCKNSKRKKSSLDSGYST